MIYRPETELASHYFQAELPQQFDEYIWFDDDQRGDAARYRGDQGTAGYLSVRGVIRPAGDLVPDLGHELAAGPLNRPGIGEELAMPYQHILVDDPRPRVRRITLNRPEKRNALNNTLRGEIFEVLEAADRDPGMSVTILRGAGTCFSAGYDLSANNSLDQPYHSRGRAGAMVAACGRGLVLDLGPGKARGRAGARLLPRRRHANSPPPAISSMSPTMPRSDIRRCG